MPYKDPEDKKAWRRKYRKDNTLKVEHWDEKVMENLHDRIIELLGDRCSRCGRDDVYVFACTAATGKPVTPFKSASTGYRILKNGTQNPDQYRLYCLDCIWRRNLERPAWERVPLPELVH